LRAAYEPGFSSYTDRANANCAVRSAIGSSEWFVDDDDFEAVWEGLAFERAQDTRGAPRAD
jgi:hypothetical protein